MPSLERGSIVKATAGKEKGSFFVVLELKKKYVIISDGRHRPIEKAKKKNLKHIIATNTVLSEAFLETNRKIRKSLNVFSELGGCYFVKS